MIAVRFTMARQSAKACGDTKPGYPPSQEVFLGRKCGDNRHTDLKTAKIIFTQQVMDRTW
jgi:hypothetical protein